MKKHLSRSHNKEGILKNPIKAPALQCKPLHSLARSPRSFITVRYRADLRFRAAMRPQSAHCCAARRSGTRPRCWLVPALCRFVLPFRSRLCSCFRPAHARSFVPLKWCRLPAPTLNSVAGNGFFDLRPFIIRNLRSGVGNHTGFAVHHTGGGNATGPAITPGSRV